MSIQKLYCHSCDKEHNVRKEDLELMQHHHADFDAKEYYEGCFFKELGRIKRSKGQNKEINEETLVCLKKNKSGNIIKY